MIISHLDSHHILQTQYIQSIKENIFKKRNLKSNKNKREFFERYINKGRSGNPSYACECEVAVNHSDDSSIDSRLVLC